MSDSKTILVISPGGLVPVQGGGTVRTWAIIDHLRENGFRVELVTGGHGKFNSEVEGRVDKLWMQLPTRKSLKSDRTPKELAWDAMRNPLKFAKSAVGVVKGRMKNRKAQLAETSILKRNRRPGIEALAGIAAYNSRPLAAIATYAWMAPALDRMPPGTIRILDTIDVQHTRRERAQIAGGDLAHIVCSRQEEISELTRADVLLAIQREEQKELAEMCPELKVLLVEHANTPRPFSSSPPESYEIMYVGNLYNPNLIGLDQFLKETWPIVRLSNPNIVLRVCGRVCEGVKGSHDGVSLDGVVDDLAPYYESAAAVINPVTYGSGLKIKSVEALGYGRCLVSTPSGTQGLENSKEVPVLIAEHGARMADHLLHCVQDVPFRHELEKRAYDYAKLRYGPASVYQHLISLLQQNDEETIS